MLYVGITSGLSRRIFKHKQKLIPGFTVKYNVMRLVYFEEFATAPVAIGREKQLKRWSRTKKIWLIEPVNPKWDDLSDD